MKSTNSPLKIYSHTDLEPFYTKRSGEVHSGETIASNPSARFVLLGIPEDIGVRANQGRRGAQNAWQAFLKTFLNQQSNDFLQGNEIALIVEVNVQDLMEQAEGITDLERLQELCGELDERVTEAVREVFDPHPSDFVTDPPPQGGRERVLPELIVIGGGHNNAFPILKGIYEALGETLNIVNFDAHADCRLLEGRHSGNPFSYAHTEKLLKSYTAIGIQESYLPQASLEFIQNADFQMLTLESIIQSRADILMGTLEQITNEVNSLSSTLGIEVDLDVIPFMPSSAMSPLGIPFDSLLKSVAYLAKNCDCRYLHLPEGAPSLSNEGERIVGRALASLVTTFIKARIRYHSESNNGDPS